MPIADTVTNGLLGVSQEVRNRVVLSLNRTNEIRQFFENVENTTGIVPMVIHGEVAQVITSYGWGLNLPRVLGLAETIENTKELLDVAVTNAIRSSKCLQVCHATL